jgi:hypothetical protein
MTKTFKKNRFFVLLSLVIQFGAFSRPIIFYTSLKPLQTDCIKGLFKRIVKFVAEESFYYFEIKKNFILLQLFIELGRLLLIYILVKYSTLKNSELFGNLEPIMFFGFE